jgi:hypothetical protein
VVLSLIRKQSRSTIEKARGGARAKGGAEILRHPSRCSSHWWLWGCGTRHYLNPHVNDVATLCMEAQVQRLCACTCIDWESKERRSTTAMHAVSCKYCQRHRAGTAESCRNPHARSQTPMHRCFSHRLVISWYRQEEWSWLRADSQSSTIHW